MTAIHRIDAYIATSDVPGAGTDNQVFLGIAGREFHIKSADQTNDFEQGAEKVYTLGEESNIADEQHNDPRHPQLDTDHLADCPAYVRFAATGAGPTWGLDRITVTINPGDASQQVYDNLALAGTDSVLWLGPSYGAYAYLSPTPVIPA